MKANKLKDALIESQAKLITILEGELELFEFDEAITRLQANLRLFRAKKGISQERLGFLIGIDNGYISKLESGERQNPSLKIMFRFCHFFECTLSELLRK